MDESVETLVTHILGTIGNDDYGHTVIGIPSVSFEGLKCGRGDNGKLYTTRLWLAEYLLEKIARG